MKTDILLQLNNLNNSNFEVIIKDVLSHEKEISMMKAHFSNKFTGLLDKTIDKIVPLTDSRVYPAKPHWNLRKYLFDILTQSFGISVLEVKEGDLIKIDPTSNSYTACIFKVNNSYFKINRTLKDNDKLKKNIIDFVNVGYYSKSYLDLLCLRKPGGKNAFDGAYDYMLNAFLYGNVEFANAFGKNDLALKSSEALMRCINSTYFRSRHHQSLNGREYYVVNVIAVFRYHKDLINTEILDALWAVITENEVSRTDMNRSIDNEFKKYFMKYKDQLSDKLKLYFECR